MMYQTYARETKTGKWKKWGPVPTTLLEANLDRAEIHDYIKTMRANGVDDTYTHAVSIPVLVWRFA